MRRPLAAVIPSSRSSVKPPDPRSSVEDPLTRRSRRSLWHLGRVDEDRSSRSMRLRGSRYSAVARSLDVDPFCPIVGPCCSGRAVVLDPSAGGVVLERTHFLRAPAGSRDFRGPRQCRLASW